jgi:hypothetical protein
MPPLLLDIVPFYMKNEVQTREMQDFYEEIVLFKKRGSFFHAHFVTYIEARMGIEGRYCFRKRG